MSKKMSFFKAFGMSVFLAFVSLQVTKDVLPKEIRTEIDNTNSDIENRLDNETKGMIQRIGDFFKRTNSSFDNRVQRIAEEKLAELENFSPQENISSQTQTPSQISTPTQGQTEFNNSENITHSIQYTPVMENNFFPSYNFSDDTYYLMVKLAAAEQGSGNEKGMAVEMCLMLNLFEQMGNEFQGVSGEEGFKKFITTDPSVGGWFASAAMIGASEAGHKDNLITRDSKKKKKMIDIANRIAKGERYIPRFVNEHVSAKSVAYITTDGKAYYDLSEIKNLNNYKKGNTIVTQKIAGGSSFMYYGHLAGTTDPFGYTFGTDTTQDVYFDFETGRVIENDTSR